jgi:hypothetical protein
VRRRSWLGWLGLAALLVVSVAGPAQAEDSSRLDNVDLHSRDRNAQIRAAALATFEGRTIDLAGDWGEAKACLVWRQGGVLECFRTGAALEAREAQLAPRRAALDATTYGATAAYSYSCSSSLRLYEYNWYSGRRLSFWDRGFWQNLSDYGFEDQLSSYIVGGCYVYMAEHADGGGWWYPGPNYPYAGEPAMSWDWQNTISSIYIG